MKISYECFDYECEQMAIYKQVEVDQSAFLC